MPDDLLPALRVERRRQAWEKLLVTGGYPEVWLAAEPTDLLHLLVEAFVLKDASDLHAIERPAVFRKILELAAADIGNLVNYSHWATVAQASRRTVARYLSIAEEAHILRLLPPFAGGKRSEVTGMPKVYFLDNGLRNGLFGGFQESDQRPDRGALWENAVLAELFKRLTLLDEVRFWRTKHGAEVDFVVRRRDRLLAIEVKAGSLRRPTVSRACRSFLEAYRPACVGIVNNTLHQDVSVDGVPVLFRRPWELDSILDFLEPS